MAIACELTPYHHGTEWNSGMLIANTIIPWASGWLFFYEFWLATGQWFGGGIPHSPCAERPNVGIAM